jgi:rfaE bifunctional protein kinase chain/domain
VKKEHARFHDLIDRFSGKTVGVWGDFILDEYLYGNTRRISREAPVLILSYQSNSHALGGAGNSLLNLRALGAQAVPIGVLGADASGRRILRMLRDKEIPTDFLLTDREYATPQKTRILAGDENTRKQQILRIDREARVPDNPSLDARLLDTLRSLSGRADALLISDYNYGTVKPGLFDEIRPDFHRSGIPVSLDSRFRLLDFPGTTVCTPNEPEAEAALHREMREDREWLRETGGILLERTRARAVLLTRGSKGMVLFEPDRPMFSIPIRGTADIVDVTGAGDTVISVITLSLAAGATFREAAVLANAAGGIVVMKKGTASVSASELHRAMEAEMSRG